MPVVCFLFFFPIPKGEMIIIGLALEIVARNVLLSPGGTAGLVAGVLRTLAVDLGWFLAPGLMIGKKKRVKYDPSASWVS